MKRKPLPPVFVCAECSYPSRLPSHCDNPGCLANPSANHAKLREQHDLYLKRKAEDEARLAAKRALRARGFTTF
jgi:hypothetical protein